MNDFIYNIIDLKLSDDYITEIKMSAIKLMTMLKKLFQQIKTILKVKSSKYSMQLKYS